MCKSCVTYLFTYLLTKWCTQLPQIHLSKILFHVYAGAQREKLSTTRHGQHDVINDSRVYFRFRNTVISVDGSCESGADVVRDGRTVAGEADRQTIAQGVSPLVPPLQPHLLDRLHDPHGHGPPRKEIIAGSQEHRPVNRTSCNISPLCSILTLQWPNRFICRPRVNTCRLSGYHMLTEG